LPKQGKHSVGVARQYCGQLGKQDNCQVAVSLSVANDHASLPVAYRLYLPPAWCEDAARRAKAGIPGEIGLATKTAIAVEQLRQALADGVPVGVVLADPAYGNETAFRAAVAELGLRYVLGVQSTTTVWPPGTAPLPPEPKPRPSRGRPQTRLQRPPGQDPVSAKALALSLPKRAWRAVSWREGSQGALSSRFAACRVRPAHRDSARAEPRAEEWLLIEWPHGEAEPTKYWLSNLPPATTLKRLVQAPGARRQGALGDRTRLPGPQARDRPRPLRGPQLARLSSSRQPRNRSRRLSHRRALPFPPSAPLRPQTSRKPCPTPGFPASRRRPSGLNVTSRSPSPPSAAASPSRSGKPSRAAHAVSQSWPKTNKMSDTVRLGSRTR
jgi:hypothetical protein